MTLVPIAWASKGQDITADSTPAAETIAFHQGVVDTVGHPVILDVGEEMDALTDNTGCVSANRKGVAKHAAYVRALGVRNSLMKDLHEKKVIRIGRVPTKLNRSDLGTKHYERIEFEGLRKLSGIVPLDSIDEYLLDRVEARDHPERGHNDGVLKNNEPEDHDAANRKANVLASVIGNHAGQGHDRQQKSETVIESSSELWNAICTLGSSSASRKRGGA